MDPCGCAKVPTNKQIDLSALADVFTRHADDNGALIAVLQETQAIYGYLPKEVLREISRVRQTPFSQVYGVATFYSQFHLRPRGETVIRICHGTACHVRGAPE
ncbi:MAG: NAD(P)H-dependent oxidoreductase subunit E, partial [Coriobacteriia bacterium]|nr:NAD(P)H-dependent oxidoreductase subunit E [Coriobacteriia bacterium]